MKLKGILCPKCHERVQIPRDAFVPCKKGPRYPHRTMKVGGVSWLKDATLIKRFDR
jgi:hypothetical protein